MNAHVVYRFYDATGRLLYVGCTKDFANRERAHRAGSSWFADVAHVAVTSFADQSDALDEELRALREESPLHNRSNRRVSRSGGTFTGQTERKAGTSFRLSADLGVPQASVLEMAIRTLAREREVD